MSTARDHRAASAETAKTLQMYGAINGAFQSGLIGLLFAGVAHHTWPAFRRKTLPFKTFVVCGFTLAGFAFGAESALVAFERSQRMHENSLRRQAQAALNNRGIMPTEAAIQEWNNERKAKLAAELEASDKHQPSQ